MRSLCPPAATLLATLFLAIAAACAHPDKPPATEVVVVGNLEAGAGSSADGGSANQDAEPAYPALGAEGENAKILCERAEQQLQRGHRGDARVTFEYTRQRFVYARCAVTAELRLADIDFAEGHYERAADEYRTFAAHHLTNDRRDYCVSRAETAACLAEHRGPCPDPADGGSPGN